MMSPQELQKLDREREAEHGRLVETTVRRLLDEADTAEHAVRIVHHSLTALTSGAAWDIELAETSGGGDALAEIETAGRALRHIRRIIGDRAALLTEHDEHEAGAP